MKKRNVTAITDSNGFRDSAVTQGDTYYYHVVAVDTYDNESDSSELEGAPNIAVVKTITDSSNTKGLRPGDTIIYTITIRNNGFVPTDSVVLYDYVPANTIFSESATRKSGLPSTVATNHGTG